MLHYYLIRNRRFLAVTYFLAAIICFSFTKCHPKKLSAITGHRQVINAELPDPSVIEVNGTYYATGSSNDWGPVYPLYKSTDLVNWTFVNHIFKQPPSWTISSYWAPELLFHNGMFYCFYTARRKDGVSCLGVATAKNIEEGFEDHGQLLEWGNEAIDAFVFNENGKLYITWKAYGLTKGKTIQILGAELSPDGLSVKGEAFEMLTAEKDSWENGGMEGQCIVRRDGYLYMLYSGNSCCGGQCNYQVGVARAKSIKGPWEKYDLNPILKGNSVWKCPGHGTVVQTKYSWYYLYHAYNEKGFPYLGRSAMLGEMFWNEKNGWPSFDTTANPDGKQIRHDLVDNFDKDTLARWWKYDVPGYKFNAQVSGGKINLAETERKNSVGAAICISPDYADFTVSATIVGKNAALKGLVLYATGSNSVGLGVKNDSLILWKVKDGNFIELNKLHVAYHDQLQLKADIVDGHVGKYYYRIDGTNWQLVSNRADNMETVNGDNLAWWSWGVKAGLFVKADPLTGNNNASFDNFVISYK